MERTQSANRTQQSEPRVRCEEHTFAGQGGDLLRASLFVAETPVARRPGLLLVHEVFGPDRHMRALAQRFARAGHCVLLPDLYSREGLPGPAGSEADPAPAWEPDTVRAAVAGLPDRRALADLDAGLLFLGARDDVRAEDLAVVGLSMGGTLAFLLGCTSTRLAGVVEFYGRPVLLELSANKPFQPIELALNLDRPVLAFFGEEDPEIPAEHVELLRRSLTAGAKDFEIVTYPGAGHGFLNEHRPGFHGPSARDAWSRTLTFLNELGGLS